LEHHQQEKHQRGLTQEWDTTQLAKFIQDYLLALGKKLGINSLDEFITYINQEQELKIICSSKQFTESDLELCRSLDTTVQKSPETFILLDSFGNFSIFSLLHWRIVLHLLAKLYENDRCALEVVTQDVVETPPLEIADAHLHLDHLLNRVGDSDLQEYDQFGGEQKFSTSMEVLVSNYCFPKFWPKREEISRLHSKIQGLKLSFGIYPKTVQTTSPELLDEYLDYLEEILKFKNTVAVGEWIELFKHFQGP
jgi:hypothetical protein